MKDVLKVVSKTITDQPVYVTVTIKPQNWWQRLQKEKTKTFAVRQLVYGNLIRIADRLVSIDESFFKEKITNITALDWNYRGLHKYGDSLAEIVAIGLYNKKDEPPKSLVEFVKANFTTEDINAVLSVVIKQMDLRNFMNSIISARGLNIHPDLDASARVAGESL